MSVRPFQIHVPDSAIADLHDRLDRTRWPRVQDQTSWEYGIPVDFLKEATGRWRHGFDWRAQEAKLNAWPQFIAEVGGVDVHFFHVRGKGPNPTPLLLLHGFPDSVYRYHKVIDRLTDPARFGGDPNLSFDVVIPSFPGTGFSARVTLDQDGDADLMAELMSGVLGYKKFVSAGGDRGALVSQTLARRNPDLVRAIHVTDVGYPDQSTDFSVLTPAELGMAQWVQKWFMEEGIGVNMIMATKPQTLAFGLSDSPVGLAAWILSYSSSGLNGRDGFKKRFDLDELLTNVSIHWFAETIASTMASYKTYGAAAQTQGPAEKPPVPAAVAHCPYDPPLPREWAERKVELARYTDFERGGHFMAWEEPEMYADDLRGFLNDLGAGSR
jgi:pimeloyl-ACP methyl ester carboxylesterase